MILDCFTFFNELDLLEGRLEYLYDTVDYFIIVETDLTHSGNPKPLNYLANIDRYKKYSNKILYFPYATDKAQFEFGSKPTQFDGDSASWKIENIQRNHIAEALKLFPDDANVIISDLDEIPKISAIQLAETILGVQSDVCCFEQELFFYNFNQKAPTPWRASSIAKNWYVKEHTPQWIRNMSWQLPTIFQGGWHLTYWGSPEKISYKIQSFAHQEVNRDEFTNTALIEQRIKEKKHPYYGDPTYGHELVPVDRATIPEEILKVFEKYSNN